MGYNDRYTVCHIETGIDRLKVLVESAKKISVKNAAKCLNVKKDIVKEWSEILEHEGHIQVDSNLVDMYLVKNEL